MATSDLNKLTTKRIRLLCEDKYQVDLTSRKLEIDSTVLEFINSEPDEDAAHKKNPAVAQLKPAEASKQESNQSSKEVSSSFDEEDQSNLLVQYEERDIKIVHKVVIDDAAYARQLQAEDWNLRERNHSQWFRDTPWKKEKNKEKKKKATSSTRKCLLSPALTEVLGTDQAPVKKEKPIKTLPPKKSYLKKEANGAIEEDAVFTTSVRQAEFGLHTRNKQGSSR